MNSIKMQMTASLSLAVGLSLGLVNCGDSTLGELYVINEQASEGPQEFSDDPSEQADQAPITRTAPSTTITTQDPPVDPVEPVKTCGCFNTTTNKFSLPIMFISPSPSQEQITSMCRVKPVGGCGTITGDQCAVSGMPGCPTQSDMIPESNDSGISCGQGYVINYPGFKNDGLVVMSENQRGHEWRETEVPCATEPYSND